MKIHAARTPATTHLMRYAALILLGITACMEPQQSTPLQPPAKDKASATIPAAETTLYVTATAHLDTQWLWTIQKTVEEYIPDTLHENFALFEKYPDYRFSFEGAFRYMLAREYYPQDYARLKNYVAQGRWNVCGSSLDGGDVNVPAPEALIRHVLYGNNFFEREFGKRSCDIYLPDCFGFGYALPSIAAHCGLKGFSTQKLTWGSSVEIPFDIGVWQGVDGHSVVASLNPGAYVSTLREDLSVSEEWQQRIRHTGQLSGVYVGHKYFGVGDVGGGPDDESVEWLEKSIHGAGALRVIHTPADQLYKDLTPQQIESLPRYDGELLMTRHGTGCYTSMCAMKRWNRQNELLADAAERACVTAEWLGGMHYPRSRLEEAWVRVLWHHMHDDLTGTSIPQAYTFSWNDELLSLNRFATELTQAVGIVARALDTQVQGQPLVVYNPSAFDREDTVEAVVHFGGGAPQAVGVYDSAGQEVPSQITARRENSLHILFPAAVPSVGFAVFDVREASSPCAFDTDLDVTVQRLENRRYRIQIDDDGDISSLYDKVLRKELLRGPARLALFSDTPDYWSEWEIRHEDIAAAPYAHFGAPLQVRVIESGPVRAAVEITRRQEGSLLTQRIRLGIADTAERAEVESLVQWSTPSTLLKAGFHLSASNERATYDLGFGVIQRPTNTEDKYEVPAQHWADLTDAAGGYGVAILNDCRYGWDKPDDHTLRLTLIHCPNDVQKDMGWHRFKYALVGHTGDWRRGNVVQQASAFNQPLLCFQTERHAGALGKAVSFMAVDDSQAVVRAVKKCETSSEIIVRVQEAHGHRAENVRLQFDTPLRSAREVDGAEQPLHDIDVSADGLTFDLEPFQPRTFALGLEPPDQPLSPLQAQPVPLPFDCDVISSDLDRSDGDFDGQGHTLPAELLPPVIVSGGVPFAMGPNYSGMNNALTCRGQTLPLPEGDYSHLYVLAASVGGYAEGVFRVGDDASQLRIHEYTGWIGQSDSLVDADGRATDADGMNPAFIHRDEVAWVGTHRHQASGDRNEPYVFCYLFNYALKFPSDASTITLPDNDRIRIMALTAANNPGGLSTPAQHLYDHIMPAQISPRGGLHIDPVTVQLTVDAPQAQIVYTLDGSLPDENSTHYSRPFELTQDATLTARVVADGIVEDYISRARFAFTEPRPADGPAAVQPGLHYRYYEGSWKSLPDFGALPAVRQDTCETIALPPALNEHQIGLVFEGFIRIDREGVYTFFTSSDDGSALQIGQRVVVSNDGLHGDRERSGRIALAKGLHAMRVVYFQGPGDAALRAGYAGPGIDRQEIPPAVLYHTAAE